MSVGLAVDVDDVSKKFPKGNVVALDHVSLTVRPGTVFGLLGPNGAGKTTLVRILSTVLRPDSGTAKVFGLEDTVVFGRVLLMQANARSEVLTADAQINVPPPPTPPGVARA